MSILQINMAAQPVDNWEASANGNPVTVVLAQIIDWVPTNPDVQTLNANIQSLATTRNSAGDNIVVVNQETALNYATDMGDDLHPNTAGYAKMSNVWFNALTSLVDKCP